MSQDERLAAMTIKDGLVKLGESIEKAARILAAAIKEGQ
jgi:hypothetical protein